MKYLRATWLIIHDAIKFVAVMAFFTSPLWIGGLLFIAFSSTTIGLALCPLEALAFLLIGAAILTYHAYMWMRGVYLEALHKVDDKQTKT